MAALIVAAACSRPPALPDHADRKRDHVSLRRSERQLLSGDLIDGRPHRAGLSSSYLGDAVGRFEGDTLVVETVNFTDETWLTDNGAFHTKGLKVTERLRRTGDTIEHHVIADDPAVLSEPWTLRPRVLRRSAQALEEPPRCEERDLEQMLDPSRFHENPR